MAQVRVVQVPIQGIQIGPIGATLNGQTVSPGIGIQLGKFNNTTGTFYRDPTNPSAGGAGQQIQVGTNISNRTLGYIVGTGTAAVTTIPTQTLPGAGYFSIWNNGNVQQSAITIQVPNCTGQQAKAQGSISNQPVVNQPLNQQAPNYYAGNQQPLNQQAPLNQPLVNQPLNQYAGNQQPLNQQAPNYYAGNQQPLVNQPFIQTPSTNQPASGLLYNGSLVNPGQVASQGFALYIPNIGTLTTQGGVLQGTGAGGGFQAPGTYIRTASSAVNTQQGIVNFQGTAHN